MQAELVFDARNAVGESPVRVAHEQSLYGVDIPARHVLRWDAAGGNVDDWSAPEMIGCIAPATGGAWVCAMETGVFHLDLSAEGAVRAPKLAPVQHARSGMRFCISQGKLGRSLELPARKPAMCAFGGPHMGTLFVTSVRPALRPGVRGLAETPCIH